MISIYQKLFILIQIKLYIIKDFDHKIEIVTCHLINNAFVFMVMNNNIKIITENYFDSIADF